MVTATPKVPRTPPAALARADSDVTERAPLLWRVHRTAGAHALAWNALRTYGPLPSLRFDPHPEPVADHDGIGVAYVATDLATALAESFQLTRVVDTRSGAPVLTAWEPTRKLRLLDLTDSWALRNQAAASLSSAPRVTCRAWARVIHATWPDLDGLWTPSTMTGRPNVELWAASQGSFPRSPRFSRPLAHPLVWSLARAAADQIGYRLL